MNNANGSSDAAAARLPARKVAAAVLESVGAVLDVAWCFAIVGAVVGILFGCVSRILFGGFGEGFLWGQLLGGAGGAIWGLNKTVSTGSER